MRQPSTISCIELSIPNCDVRGRYPKLVSEAFAEFDEYFPTLTLQKFQFYDKYSRFNYDFGP